MVFEQWRPVETVARARWAEPPPGTERGVLRQRKMPLGPSGPRRPQPRGQGRASQPRGAAALWARWQVLILKSSNDDALPEVARSAKGPIYNRVSHI